MSIYTIGAFETFQTQSISLSSILPGEDVGVNLYGGAYDANVRLDKNSLRIENTYISMANQRTVTISNRSDVIVHYKWKQCATSEEEEQQKQGWGI